MKINNLPPDILTLILKQAVGIQSQSMQTWKQTIQLLAVCRSWRILAQKWVYYWAFIECHESPNEDYYTDGQATMTGQIAFSNSSSADEMGESDGYYVGTHIVDSPKHHGDWPVWVTNIDFHRLHGDPYMVKRLELYLDAPVNIIEFLRKVKSILDLGKSVWPKISLLDISLYSVLSEVGDNTEYEHKHIAEINQITYMLKKSLMNVVAIEICGHLSHQEDALSHALATNIVNLFSGHLHSIICLIPTSLLVPTLSGNTRSVMLVLDASKPFGSTKIPTTSLESLRLTNVSVEFSWHMLAEKPDTNVIYLPKLKELGLVYNSSRRYADNTEPMPFGSVLQDAISEQQSGYLNNNNVLKICIPKLEWLRLEYLPPTSPIFYASSYKPHFKNLHVSGPLTTIQQLLRMEIRSVNTMFIYLDSIDAANEKLFYAVTNYLFGSIKISTSLDFIARMRFPFAINTKQLKWTNLTSLCFSSTIEYNVLIDIISCIPRLTDLVFYNVDLNPLIDDVDHIDSPRWKILLNTPLNTNVLRMGMMGKYRQHSTHFVCNVIYMLVQRMQKLESVHINTIFKDQTNMLLSQSEQPHPLVKKVNVEISGF
ncbi:hypothetical protein BX070DRAFT_257604 [Coemansia spiralis]|nr:hypothetical protein BX070DRAFT_257604 [Coemansia spiralis]